MRPLSDTEKQIIELDKLLENFDFYYEVSTDDRYVESCALVKSRIRFLIKKINDYAITSRIWNKYAPQDFQKVETTQVIIQ